MSSAGVTDPSVIVSAKPSTLVSRLSQRPLILGIILVLATAAVYYPVHGHPFVNFDDNDYVYENPHVQAGLTLSTLKWACTSTFAANWHPLTWMSHALDCQLFGVTPGGPHDVNAVLHILDAVLLFWVFLQATNYVGRSFMVAALFALHPINVESVAWISERKTMLSMVFFLLAMAAYRWYALQPKLSRYLLVCALFAVGLTAKSQIIILPCVLVLWDYWPLERVSLPFLGKENKTNPLYPAKPLSWILIEKIPLFVIAAASAFVTMKAQHGARSWFPRIDRAGNAVLSYGLYIKKMFWPSGLAPMYPHPSTFLNWGQVAASAVALFAITVLVALAWRRRYLTVGWLWFIGTMVPMLGIIQVGQQAMADRYAYISFLGLFVMLCWGIADWTRIRRTSPALLPAVSVVLLLVFAILTRNQLKYWESNEELWTHTLAVTTRNWIAEDQIGAMLAMRGQVPQAMPHFYSAISLSPTDSTSNMAIAIYDLRHQDYAGALDHYRVVIKNEKEKPKVLLQAYQGMAQAYHGLGDTVEEQDSLDQASALMH